ncbi:hypothetical protein EJV47_11725 [Hymenobacter gummosus]|uniref:Uncharacterized protein n=1 Tax=Hymenobacter gummosus TaxID=1776032 RepID=A0A431U3V1_9BACT|nr:hypothetical protein [Hymenobacter gummosus]RTQ50288.1 hypothetical protein EJV47_11725 [Hymenobacter gummosus]
MYDEQLTALIDATIADGQLTDKERQVLTRKAQSFGVDADEFEVYLAGRLFERQRELRDDELLNQQLQQRATRLAPPAPPYAAAPADRDRAPLSKCPACKEPLSGLSHVCPACGQLVDAEHDAHGSLEEMMGEMEDLLIEAKAQAVRPQSQLSRSGALYLVPTLLALVLSVVSFAFVGNEMGWGWWVIAALAFGVGWLIDRALQLRRQPPAPTRHHRPLAEIQAEFDKHARQITLFFGADRQVRQVVDTLGGEMSRLRAAPAAAGTYLTPRRVLGGLCLLALGLGPLLSRGRVFPADTKAQMARGEQLVEFGRLPEARRLLDSLELEPNRVRLASLIQHAELEQRLDSVPELLTARRYTEARRRLERLRWRRISPDAAYLYQEQPAFQAFQNRKTALNEQLPANYQLLVDTTFSR